MQTQSNQFLAKAIIIGGILVVIAALIVAFTPMLWTDHVVRSIYDPVPAGCSIQTTAMGGGGAIVVAHCPSWVHV